jgi:hypothetical protein
MAMINRTVRNISAVIAFGVSLTVSTAGFKPEIHAGMLRRALPANKVIDADALDRVIAANEWSDRPTNQDDAERHFDNGMNPAGICNLWKAGVDTYLNRAVALAEPAIPEKRTLSGRNLALDEFGKATHAIQDFYSHTNWIELHAASHGAAPAGIPQAPILGQSCDPAAFPPDLYSGYFTTSYTLSTNGIGCPPVPLGPPRGFKECHSKLNKDSSSEPKGGTPYGSGLLNHHQVALAVAEAATKSAWRALGDRIEARYDSETTDGKCVFAKLAWDGNRSCHRKWGAVGGIKTRQEYAVPAGQLIHELDLNDLSLSFHIGSADYLGPDAPAVYADVRGTTHQRGTFCQWAVTSKGSTPKQCQPYRSDTIGSDDGRIKVTPHAEPIELDWRVTFPGKAPECSGPVIVRLDRGAPAKQPFLNCPGGMPFLKPIRLAYGGVFSVAPE